MNIDRRIANAVKRVHAQIDEQSRDALWQVGIDGANAWHRVNEAFNSAARSLGQFRRHRNKGDSI